MCFFQVQNGWSLKLFQSKKDDEVLKFPSKKSFWNKEFSFFYLFIYKLVHLWYWKAGKNDC